MYYYRELFDKLLAAGSMYFAAIAKHVGLNIQVNLGPSAAGTTERLSDDRPMARMQENQIICGDAREVLSQMPSGLVNCCITSPPYWGLRKYGAEPITWPDGWQGELGLEPTIELYIEHLMLIFDEVKRVLRDDGILFVNIGDTYAGTPASGTQYGTSQRGSIKRHNKSTKIPAKSLCAIPERFVLAMMERGWIRRCTIIWAKGLSFCDEYSGSCMPDSAKDRPNKNAFEYVYMFTKSRKYFYEQQYEEAQELNAERPRMGQGNQTIYNQKRWSDYQKRNNFGLGSKNKKAKGRTAYLNPLGRIVRNVWAINPQAFPDAHFATFPEKLVEICLKMGCPEFVCKKCGKAKKKIYNAHYNQPVTRGSTEINRIKNEYGYRPDKIYSKNNQLIGYTDCGCRAGWRPGICLDPFRGQWNRRQGGRAT